MKLRFSENQIQNLCERYSYSRGEQELINLRQKVANAGFLTKDQLKNIALWKSPRSAGRIESNDTGYVLDITRFAFSTQNERSRIEALTLLDGVKWPTASVILHFFHPDPYPILDFRALWSVSVDVPNAYTFEFWWPYVEFCRSMADRNSIDMRTLDQALWQFSKEKQSSKKPKIMTEKKSTKGTTRGTVYCVSCVSQKRTQAIAAKDLYISSLFTKARHFVEESPAPWFILSAKYGLVHPDEVIEPYDLTLNNLGVADRRRWANQVLGQIQALKTKPKKIVMLAGARYREFLEPKLKDLGIQVDVPMEGLRIGEQLSWLSQKTNNG